MSQSPLQDSGEQAEAYDHAWATLNRLLREGRSLSGRERNCAFLNLGQANAERRFAEVSTASGFDFPDDGRALALVDWDSDGDFDVDVEMPSLSIDFEGYVWLVDMGHSAFRIDPETHDYEVYGDLVGPYTYSDMTGFGLASVTNPQG